MSKKYEILDSLLEFAEILSGQNDYQETLRIVTLKASVMVNAGTSLILMINPQTRETIKTIFKQGKEIQHDRYRLVHISVSGWVFNHKKSILSPDIKNDERFEGQVFRHIAVRSVIGVPFKLESIIVGCLLLINAASDSVFTENDLAIIQKLCVIASPYLRNAQKLKAYFEAPLPEATLRSKYQAAGLIGKSAQFTGFLRAIEAAAHCDVRVLLEGQTGTGKALVAKAIHQFSARSTQPFLAIDCGTIPENLIESELLGHKRGAFTGATTDRKGLLEEATGGTLFLDEIGNLPISMQTKLLRVLQEGEIRPLGSNITRKVNVRVICATSSSLRDLIKTGRFREDLFYRLYVYPIFVPSLQERREDIVLLANYFLKKFASQQQKQTQSFHETLLDFMKQRAWPGNIRELENFVERLVTLASPDADTIGLTETPPDLKDEYEEYTLETTSGMRQSLQDVLNEYEKNQISDALIKCNWNQSQAARLLKLSKSNIRFRMTKLNIKRIEE